MIETKMIAKVKVKINNGMFCINDLHKAGGGEKRHSPSYFLSSAQIKGLAQEVTETTGIPAISKSPGRRGGTFLHKHLVYAYAMWINPKFHMEIIEYFDANAKAEAKITNGINALDAIAENVSKEFDRICLDMDELDNHGRIWSCYGAQIKKAKKVGKQKVMAVVSRLQLKLDFK